MKMQNDCDIVLHGDPTVSRTHAVITVVKEDDKITVTDQSKIGVLVNDRKIAQKESVPINVGDVIGFGRYPTKFILQQQSLHVVMSAITNSSTKSHIRSLVDKLGGSTLSDWSSEATLLVMEKLTFTIKVVCCLAGAKFIVTPKYLEDLLDFCGKKRGLVLPEEKNYLPPIEETSLLCKENLFVPNKKRTTIMAGKQLFVLAQSQYKRIHLAFRMAGGDVHLEDGQRPSTPIASQQTLVLQTEKKDDAHMTSQQKILYQQIRSKLNGHQLRFIKESEIGLAILHSSLEHFCNPSLSEGKPHSQLLTDTMVTQLAEQTQPLFSKEQTSTQRAVFDEFPSDGCTWKKRKISERCNPAGSKLRKTSVPDTPSDISFDRSKCIVDDDPFASIDCSEIPESELIPYEKPAVLATNTIISNVPSSKPNEEMLSRPISGLQISSVEEKTLKTEECLYFDERNNESISDEQLLEVVSDTQMDSLKQEDILLETSRVHLQSTMIDSGKPCESGDWLEKSCSGPMNFAPNRISRNVDMICFRSCENSKSASNFFGKSGDFDDRSSEITEENAQADKKRDQLNLSGFISCVNKKSTVLKQEQDDPDLMGVARDLLQTAYVSLVVKSTYQIPTQRSFSGSMKNSKNFKRFKKQYFAGSGRKSHVIRSTDLVVFQSHNSQRDLMFGDFKEENDVEEEKVRKMNEIFDHWGTQRGTIRRAKR